MGNSVTNLKDVFNTLLETNYHPKKDRKKLMDKKIYILDDHYFFCKILEEMMYNMGFKNIESFTDEYRFLQKLEDRPDLLFIDHNLKESDGTYILSKIGEKESYDPKIVYMSNNVRIFMKVVDDYPNMLYLSKKSLNPKELKSCIMDSLND